VNHFDIGKLIFTSILMKSNFFLSLFNICQKHTKFIACQNWGWLIEGNCGCQKHSIYEIPVSTWFFIFILSALLRSRYTLALDWNSLSSANSFKKLIASRRIKIVYWFFCLFYFIFNTKRLLIKLSLNT
jgi:hypothetical protein